MAAEDLKITATPKELQPLSYYRDGIRKNLAARGSAPEIPLLSMPSLNDKIWGFQRGKVYILAARPSIGKSAFSLQTGYDLALQGLNVLVLSLEMTVEDMIERLFCHACQVNNNEVLRGGFSKHAESFEQFYNKLESMRLVLSDCIGKETEEIESMISKMTVKPDVIIVDHLNAIKSSGFNTKMDIDAYVDYLRTMTKKNNLVTILCCQINRIGQDDKDKTPKLHDLKGSGNLEEAADVVLLLHWPFKYKTARDTKIKRSDFMVIVAKNRNGPTGFVNMSVNPETYTYKDAYVAEAEAPVAAPIKLKEPPPINQEDIKWEE